MMTTYEELQEKFGKSPHLLTDDELLGAYFWFGSGSDMQNEVVKEIWRRAIVKEANKLSEDEG